MRLVLRVLSYILWIFTLFNNNFKEKTCGINFFQKKKGPLLTETQYYAPPPLPHPHCFFLGRISTFPSISSPSVLIFLSILERDESNRRDRYERDLTDLKLRLDLGLFLDPRFLRF